MSLNQEKQARMSKKMREMLMEAVTKLSKEYGFEKEDGEKLLGLKKEVSPKKPVLALPWTGEVCSDWCKGVRPTHGLYSQCTNSAMKGEEYCKTCGNKDDIPTVYNREEWMSKNGKKAVHYGSFLKKKGITREEADREGSRFGLTIPESEYAEKQSSRGRPRKTAATSDTESEDEEPRKRGRPTKEKAVDMFAELVAEHNAKEAAEELEAEATKAAEKEANAKLKAEKDAEKEAKAKLKAEKDAEKAKLKAEKDAEKEAKAKLKAEKEAEKEAKAKLKAEKDAEKAKLKAEKDAEKEAKAKLKAEKDAEKEAKAKLKAEKDAEKAKLKAEKDAEKEAKAKLKAEKEAEKEAKAKLKAEKDAEKAKLKAEREAAREERRNKKAAKKVKAEAEPAPEPEPEPAPEPEPEEEPMSTAGWAEPPIENTVEAPKGAVELYELFGTDTESEGELKEEEYSDEAEVEQWEHNGVKYLLNKGSGDVYDRKTQEHIGIWNGSEIEEVESGSDTEEE